MSCRCIVSRIGPSILSPIMLPIVAIVGRPNVGKSSLLNFLAGRRLPVANNADGTKLALQTADFYTLGYGDPIPISCTTRQGKEDLLKAIIKRVKPKKSQIPADPEMKLAVVGKRNAGKSTLVNALAGQ